MTADSDVVSVGAVALIQTDEWIKSNTKKDIAYMNALLDAMANEPAFREAIEKELAITEAQPLDSARQNALCGTGNVFWRGMTDVDDMCQPENIIAFADFTNVEDDGKMHFKDGSALAWSGA